MYLDFKLSNIIPSNIHENIVLTILKFQNHSWFEERWFPSIEEIEDNPFLEPKFQICNETFQDTILIPYLELGLVR